MPVCSRLQQPKVKLLHNFMQHKIKGRFEKEKGKEEKKSPLCNHAEHRKPGVLPDFLFEDP